MSSVKLTDGRVLHFPGAPMIEDGRSLIVPLADADLIAVLPFIPHDELLLFAGRLVSGARKRRRQPRWAEVNAARLRLARACIDRALLEWFDVQEHMQ